MRLVRILLVMVGIVLLAACGTTGSDAGPVASPTPVIIDGVNLSLVGKTGRLQFIYAYADW